MNCIKCGKELQGQQVFCDDCLLDMQTHPVAPGAVVTLPNRPVPQPAKKAPARKKLTPEEQVARLRKVVARLRIAVVVLLACLILVGAALMRSVETQRILDNIGKNYNTITPEDTD